MKMRVKALENKTSRKPFSNCLYAIPLSRLYFNFKLAHQLKGLINQERTGNIEWIQNLNPQKVRSF